MRDLAAVLNIKAPSIYSHFASKAELMRSLVMPAADEVNALMDQAPTGGDEEARLAWFDTYERWLIENQEICRVALLDPVVRADPIVGPAVLQTRHRVLGLMRQFGALNDGAARAATGALIYPAIIPGTSEREIPQVVHAAIRALA